jgi:hypothetical protein
MIGTVLDLGRPVFAIINEFPLDSWVQLMRERHPKWSDKQLRCCLYWQPVARRELRQQIMHFLLYGFGDAAYARPEAMGVNVTDTLHRIGIELEWPPVKIVRQVAVGGFALPRRSAES